MDVAVKVCGITNADDALMVASAGVAALGFVFWPKSPRVVTPEVVRDLAPRLPAHVLRVGVFVNARPSEVAGVVAAANLNAAQLHGDEDPYGYTSIGVPLLKAMPLTTEADAERASKLPPEIVPIVDAADHVRRGGTGEQANWALAARLAATRPILLAGGLHAGNVADAIRIVRPWGIDVSSGVESRPGKKSPEKVLAFLAAVAMAREVM